MKYNKRPIEWKLQTFDESNRNPIRSRGCVNEHLQRNLRTCHIWLNYKLGPDLEK